MKTIKEFAWLANFMGWGLLAGVGLFIIFLAVSTIVILVSPGVGVLAALMIFVSVAVWHIKHAPNVTMS